MEHLQEICDKEDIKADKAALHIIAQKSEGCMRDSLSILDKIVSFTSGKVTYANTLEHLNILDEDYYFRLLDYLMAQDVSSALLMYDEINRKGFEGDTVLNGFAEFLRNLLVSSDAKVAMLLEVADDFKQKYLQVASKVPASFIISALNILTEAEIGYRQARNKRLHVELAIIKLSYLQQALELVNDNGVSKKKITDSKVVAFKALPVYKVTSDPLPITTGKALPKQEAKLIIEEPEVKFEKTSKPSVAAQPSAFNPPSSPAGGLSSLNKLREKIKEQNSSVSEAKTITETELQLAWEELQKKLRTKANNSAVTNNLKSASIKIIDNNCVEIIVGSDIQKAFVETQRADLVDHLQAWFNNRALTYVVSVEETAVEEKPQEIQLSRKQQYMKMIEEYPMVKELKERLKLELE